VVELELDSNQFANIYEADGNTVKDTEVNKTFTIDDVVMFGDIVTLDNSLNNSYIEALMSGTALTVPFTSFVSQSHIMSQTHQFNVNIIRSFTRLKSLFVSFYADAPTESRPNPTAGEPAIWTQDDGLNIAASGDTTGSVVLKTFNRFYNPMGRDGANPYNSTYELQWQISIGSLVFPVYPSRSLSETFYRLKGALGILPSAFHAVDIKYTEYCDTHFIIGIDLERITDAAYSGLNTKAGDLVSVKTM